MIFLSLGLLGLGVADLVRWSPGTVGRGRVATATAMGSVAVVAVAALGGMDASAVLLVAAVALAVLWVWSAYDPLPEKDSKPQYALGGVLFLLAVLLALGSLADPIEGNLATWYSNLGFGFVKRVSVDQFVLGLGAFLFLLVTGNRLVRFTLAATGTSLTAGEGALRGGRVLGPMERLIVAATVISGSVAGAGFVIAAKGLLRFREIRGADSEPPKVDEISEYFLIGTFTGVLIAGAVGVLLLAAG